MNPDPQRPRLRVFLVDDAVPVLHRMSAMFGALDGVDIVGVTEEPDVAVAGVDTAAADLVVMDSHLNGGNGIELLARLARTRPHMIVMVLTNHSGIGFRRACLSSGAHYFFDKTGEFDLACTALRRIAGEHCARVRGLSGARHV